MIGAISIHEHDIIDLLATYSEGIRLSQLIEVVGEKFGKSVTFHTGSSTGLDLDSMLRNLEFREKVKITSGVLYPSGITD